MTGKRLSGSICLRCTVYLIRGSLHTDSECNAVSHLHYGTKHEHRGLTRGQLINHWIEDHGGEGWPDVRAHLATFWEDRP